MNEDVFTTKTRLLYAFREPTFAVGARRGLPEAAPRLRLEAVKSRDKAVDTA
jgi:hypothetical protein